MYIGNQPLSQAFVTDQFSGNGSTTAFTMSVAPANTASVLVAVSGVLQDPSTYSVSGTTLTFSAAPPTATGNISARYLGIPASGVTTTAYRTVTEFTATAGQTTFSTASYTAGYLDVYRNGVKLGSADYTATNGTTVVLAAGATAGDLVTTVSFYVSSVVNAIPATTGSISSTYIAAGAVGTTQIANSAVTPTQLNTQAQYTGFKNRIINGAMVIDQRNNGASSTPTSVGAYTYSSVDRFYYLISVTSKFTMQQNAGSITAPAGFSNYLGVTSSSAYSISSSDYFVVGQTIEGFNTADLNWGTANAKTVTLSFQVYSSLTGTFGGALMNGASNYSYPFSYTISSANTWTTVSITIAGPTSGTWIGATNAASLRIHFGLGVGSTLSGTAGSWTANAYYSATSATSVVGTSGATFYIAGVQLEAGSTATSFDVRSYTTELSLCERYYFKTFPQGTAPAQAVGSTAGALLVSTSATSTFGGSSSLPVTMRTAPTVTTYNPISANANWRDTNNASDRTVNSGGGGDSSFYAVGLAGIVNGLNFIHITASAEL